MGIFINQHLLFQMASVKNLIKHGKIQNFELFKTIAYGAGWLIFVGRVGSLLWVLRVCKYPLCNECRSNLIRDSALTTLKGELLLRKKFWNFVLKKSIFKNGKPTLLALMNIF